MNKDKEIENLKRYKYAYESIIKSLKGNLFFLKRNNLSDDRIDEDNKILETLIWFYENYDGDFYD